MPTPKIFESEYRFCLILWENEPISSGDLVKLILPNAIGDCAIVPTPVDKLKSFIQAGL